MDGGGNLKNVGERMKSIRKSRKLTQTQFGKKLGVTYAHISNIERGRDNSY